MKGENYSWPGIFGRIKREQRVSCGEKPENRKNFETCRGYKFIQSARIEIATTDASFSTIYYRGKSVENS